MKIKRPESPFQASTEPIDQQGPEISKLARGDFAEALSQLESAVDDSQAGAAVSGSQVKIRSALLEIANSANLMDSEQAAYAVRQSARYMVGSRLSEKYRGSAQGQNLIESVSGYVADDPLLKSKLLTILKRVKSE